MTLSKLSATLALAAALFTATSLGAMEANDKNNDKGSDKVNEKAKEKADAQSPVINTVCPMDGKPIDMAHCSMMKMTIGEGADAKQCRMAMCTDACMTEFKKDPAAALKPVFGKGAPGPKTQYK